MTACLKGMAGLLVPGMLCLMTQLAHAQPKESTPVRRPNVILIYTDDQGTVDAGCYGSEDLITPAIDRLAARGIRFTQMYAPSAICSASRAGMLTGRFPARAGVRATSRRPKAMPACRPPK